MENAQAPNRGGVDARRPKIKYLNLEKYELLILAKVWMDITPKKAHQKDHKLYVLFILKSPHVEGHGDVKKMVPKWRWGWDEEGHVIGIGLILRWLKYSNITYSVICTLFCYLYIF